MHVYIYTHQFYCSKAVVDDKYDLYNGISNALIGRVGNSHEVKLSAISLLE